MNDVILQMIEGLSPESRDAYDTALKEVIQRIGLLGMWRARFFEHAAFYGGTALRLLYGLDRFSEDLDFSLLQPSPEFRLHPYLDAVRRELEGFGFQAEIVQREKSSGGPIKAAFVKSNTRLHLLQIGAPERITRQVPVGQLLKVKIEVDTDPPPGFDTEIRYILQPAPFSVRVFVPQDLFAGKMHALLCRRWGQRVKGRDWYDMVWFAGRKTPLNLDHLAARMRQTGDWPAEEPLDPEAWKDRLFRAIEALDIEAAKQDVLPFLRDTSRLALWSEDFFKAVAEEIPASSGA